MRNTIFWKTAEGSHSQSLGWNLSFSENISSCAKLWGYKARQDRHSPCVFSKMLNFVIPLSVHIALSSSHECLYKRYHIECLKSSKQCSEVGTIG